MSDLAVEPVEPVEPDAYDEPAALDPAVDLGDYPEGEEFDLSDFELDDEPLPVEPASPRITREQWQAGVDFITRRVAEVEQELGLGELVNPATGHTEAQSLARADLELEAWLEQGDPSLRDDRRARAEEIASELGRTYGLGPEIAWAAMQLADQEVVGNASGNAELSSMVTAAAKMRGLEDFDVEKAMSNATAAYPEILRVHPDIGEVAFGLAALAAIADQDPRDEWSLTDSWGAAAKLVEHLKDPKPQPTEHDYTKGGTAAGRFFGRNADIERTR
jgi:hypothetical protein